MSEAVTTIKIKYKDLAPGSAFVGAFNQVAAHAFGGRADQAIMGVSRRIARAQQEYKELREKAFRAHGKPDKKKGNYTVEHLGDDKYAEFEKLMDDYAETEVDLKISAPIKVKHRKIHRFSPLAAGLVAELIEVEYDEKDEGEYLDKLSE
jgi:hypothetical protein